MMTDQNDFSAAALFADLDTDVMSEPAREATWQAPAEGQRAALKEGEFTEVCPSCRGSGRWGFQRRECFACKGRGRLTHRQKVAKEAHAKGKVTKARNLAERREAWIQANPTEYAWLLDACSRGFSFAVAMADALAQYGTLTEKQMATVQRLVVQDAERKARWAREQAEREANAAAVDVTRIATAFETAASKGLKRPKLRLDVFTFSPAPKTGTNAGAIYVKEGETYLGKILGGKFTRSFVCTAEQEDGITRAASDPVAAATAYGQRTGNCACCNRELTAKESLERAIGPICAEKFGW